jgi:hypothetical protein
MSKKYPDAPANSPDCLCCHDTGLVGGDITPPNDCPYSFCKCAKGRERSSMDPNAADWANMERDRLMGLK